MVHVIWFLILCLFSYWLTLRRKFVRFKKGSGSISKRDFYIFLILNFIWIDIPLFMLTSMIIENPYRDPNIIPLCWLLITFLVGCYIFYQYKQYKKIKEKEEDIITDHEDVDL